MRRAQVGGSVSIGVLERLDALVAHKNTTRARLVAAAAERYVDKHQPPDQADLVVEQFGAFLKTGPSTEDITALANRLQSALSRYNATQQPE